MAQSFEFKITSEEQYKFAKEKIKLLSKENPSRVILFNAIKHFEWMQTLPLVNADDEPNKTYAAYAIEAEKLKEKQKLAESIEKESKKALQAKWDATKATLASMSSAFGGYYGGTPEPTKLPPTDSYGKFLDFINSNKPLEQYQEDILAGSQSSPTPSDAMIKKATKSNSIAADLGILMAQLLDEYKKIKDPQFLSSLNEHICSGTSHKDIGSYHNDYNVPLVEKVKRYCEVISKIQNRKNDLGAMLSKPAFSDTDAQETIDKQVQFIQSLDAKLQKMTTQLEELVVVNSQLKHQLQEEQKQKVHVTNIMLHDKVTFTLNTETEKHHKQLMQLFNYLRARNHEGFSEFLWVDGAPGSGKTRIGRTLAKMLGVGFYPRPADPTVTSNKLTGFNNLLNGSFVEGWFYKPFKEGGLLALDEGDLMDASCFAGCNSIENSEYTFGNGELIQRHKDFYLIVFANTRGQGAQRGFQRNKLDAATLDRFTMVELEYDEKMEQEVYGDPEWAQYVQRVREDVKKNVPGAVYITPRATRKGAAYLAQGMEPAEVALNTIFKLCSEDTRNAIIQRVGVFMRKNVDAEKLTGVFALNTEGEFDPHSRDALWNKMPGVIKLWVNNLIKENSGSVQQKFMKICTKYDKHERLLALLYFEFRCYVVNGQHNYWMHGDYAKELCNHPQIHTPEMSHGFVQEFVCGFEENQTKGWMYSYTKPRVKVKKTVSGDWVPDDIKMPTNPVYDEATHEIQLGMGATIKVGPAPKGHHEGNDPRTGKMYLSVPQQLWVEQRLKYVLSSDINIRDVIVQINGMSPGDNKELLKYFYFLQTEKKFVMRDAYAKWVFTNYSDFLALMDTQYGHLNYTTQTKDYSWPNPIKVVDGVDNSQYHIQLYESFEQSPPVGQPVIDLTGESYLGTNLKSIADELHHDRLHHGLSNMGLIERINKLPEMSLEMKGTLLQNAYWRIANKKHVLTNEYVSYIFNNVNHFSLLMQQWGDSFQDIDTKTESMGIIHRNPVNPTAHKV
jgi:hypothetical protein